MNVLGIFNAHNSGAALIQNGRLTFAVSEERLNRNKFSIGFPHLSIDECLKFAKISSKEIDCIAYGGYSAPSIDAIRDYFETYREHGLGIATERIQNSLSVDYEFISDFFWNCGKHYPATSIRNYDHHYCHALSALFSSGFKESYVITADGRGDLQSLVVWEKKSNSEIHRKKTFCELKSLGFFYGQITKILGFTPHRHEGKITGLAAFGKETKLLSKFAELIWFQDGDIRVSVEYMPFNRPNNISQLESLILGYKPEDVAWAAQKILEDIVIGVIKHYVPVGSNLCMAGGIFANVKLNQRIRENCKLSNYYIYPEMGDGGICVGSAIAASLELGQKIELPKNMFIGPEYKWDEVNLDSYQVVHHNTSENFLDQITDLLISGNIIGVYSGRMEFGPRSLGSRSIVMAACDNAINQIANIRLNRSDFMPFAPYTLSEFANEMYIDFDELDQNTQFMTTCYQCTGKMKRISPAVVHVDGTARPQIVDESFENRLYLSILKLYHQKTGIPSLVNTSFNNHEEPIVCRPIDALSSLDNGNIDYIVTDCQRIISKKNTENN